MKTYYKHKIENLLVVSRIVTTHYFELRKDFVGPTESHDFWELVYADKGDLICRADEKEVVLHEGELLFHKPGELHSLRADGVHAPNVIIISFASSSSAIGFFENRKILLDKSLLRLLFSIVGESTSTFDLMYPDHKLRKMEILPSAPLGGLQIIKNYLEIFLINLIRHETKQGSDRAIFLQGEHVDEVISATIIDYMKQHVAEKLTADDVCGILHYNRSYIFKQFKKATGSSVMAYFSKLKIEKSKQLLRETDLPISQIATMLSFENANYFFKTFKKLTGYTPSTYRRIRKKQ